MLSDDVPAAQLDERDLAHAVDGNVQALFRAMEALDGAESEVDGGLARHHAWPANPMFKGVWSSRLRAGDVDDAIGRSVEWLRARGAPFAFWWTGADPLPPSLPDGLARSGWTSFERDAPGMVAELDALDRGVLERLPAAYEQREVLDGAGLDAFADVFTRSFDVPSWAARAWVEATAALTPARAPWAILVGRLAGSPVSATIAFPGAGVASVFGVGTVPEARGRGLGAAITLGGLDLLRERGYRYGVLFATPAGEPVYRRLGFRLTGHSVSRWLWRAG